MGDAFGPRLAVLRDRSRSSRLRPAGAIAIAALCLAGCGNLEADDISYSIAGYIAEGVSLNPRAVDAAREALADGKLTNAEYDRIQELDDEISYHTLRKRQVIREWSRK